MRRNRGIARLVCGRRSKWLVLVLLVVLLILCVLLRALIARCR
jgi:hypothetical protein